MFVCTLYKSTFLNHLKQTLHTFPPWSGRDRRVCMGPQYFTFPTSSNILSGAGADSCAVDGCRRHIAPLLRYIRDAARAGVTSRTAVGCAMKTRRSEWNACVSKWKPDETGRK
jgi:hypothetical protein